MLQLSELGLILGLTSQQAVSECRKNLREKLPDAEPVFEQIIKHSLLLLPEPPQKEIEKYQTMAHIKDLPILTAAIKDNAQFLTTFNTRHFNPDPKLGLSIVKPGELLQKIRSLLQQLG